MKSAFLRGASVLGLALGAATASLGVAYAQEPSTLDEIVVTARAKGESVQTVPLAITAYSGEDLQKRAVVDMKDVSRLTPGFAFEDYGGTGSTSPVIRGATQIAGSAEQPVSFFLDGVYLPRSYVTDVGFWGIERLEVVKGPQSARYGRNAFSGAVNYVTKAPTKDFTAEVEGTVGIYDRYEANALVSGTIIPEKLTALAGVSYSTFDGSWKNSHPFCDINFDLGTNCRVGGYENHTYNGSLHFTPTDKLTIDATFFKFQKHREETALMYFGELNADSSTLNCGQYNPNVRPAGSGTGGGGQWYRLYCGELPAKGIAVDPRGYGSQLNANFRRISAQYDLTDSLKLSYVYGRVSAENKVNQYNDIIPGCTYFISGTCIFSTVGIQRNLTESHDVRLSFDNGGNLTGSIGYLYAPQVDFTQSAFAGTPQLTAVPTQALHPDVASGYTTYVILSTNLTKNEVRAPFAEVQLKLMDGRLRLGAEGRYTEEQRYQQALASSGGSGVLAASGAAFRAKYTYFTPRFTVDYDLAPRHLLYGSVAKGVKSGGFNTTAYLPENRVYDGDQNWTYEAGSKNTWGDLRVNASVFLIKWSDMQIPASDPNNPAVLPQVITLNLGNFTSKGVELESEYRFSSRFTLSGTAYYGQATYDSGTYHLNYARTPAVCDNVVCPTNGYIGGNQAPRAPKGMATLSGEWRDTVPFADSFEYYARSDLTYQSKAYADEMNLAWAPARTVVNATLGVTGERYEVQLWFRNLFDKKYLSVASIQQPNVAYTGSLGERRTMGLTFSAKY